MGSDRKKEGEKERIGEIDLEKRGQYFRRQLEGVEWKVVQDNRDEMKKNGEENIRREEIKKALKQLKSGKAVGGMECLRRFGGMSKKMDMKIVCENMEEKRMRLGNGMKE